MNRQHDAARTVGAFLAAVGAEKVADLVDAIAAHRPLTRAELRAGRAASAAAVEAVMWADETRLLLLGDDVRRCEGTRCTKPPRLAPPGRMIRAAARAAEALASIGGPLALAEEHDMTARERAGSAKEQRP